MTRDDQFIGQLEGYLDAYEGITPLPEAVRDAIRAELPKTKQAGPTLGLARFSGMSNAFKVGIAAAVIGIAALIGFSFYNNGIGTVPDGPSSTPSPTSVSLTEGQWDGTIPPGEYYLDLPVYPARIEFEVPDGWFYFSDMNSTTDSTVHTLVVDSLDTGAANGSAWGISFTVIDDVQVDPCDTNAGTMDASVTESADSLAEAFSSWPGFPPTSVEDVTVSGFSGKRVEITRDEGACDSSVMFTTPSFYQFGAQFSSSEPVVNQFTLLDVEGSVLVIWTTDYPGTSEFEEDGGAPPDPQAHVADQVELHDILDSIVLQPH